MKTPRRSLSAQISEVSMTLEERRRAASARLSDGPYRLESLAAALDTLTWLQANGETIRRLMRNETLQPSGGTPSPASSTDSSRDASREDSDPPGEAAPDGPDLSTRPGV
jgi:hypothetical protein